MYSYMYDSLILRPLTLLLLSSWYPSDLPKQTLSLVVQSEVMTIVETAIDIPQARPSRCVSPGGMGGGDGERGRASSVDGCYMEPERYSEVKWCELFIFNYSVICVKEWVECVSCQIGPAVLDEVWL